MGLPRETVIACRIALALALLALAALLLEGCATRVPPEADVEHALLPASTPGWYLIREELMTELISSQRACVIALSKCSEDGAYKNKIRSFR